MEYKKVPNRFASVRVNTTGCFRFQFRLGKIRSSNRYVPIDKTIAVMKSFKFDKHIVVASDDGSADVYKRYWQFHDHGYGGDILGIVVDFPNMNLRQLNDRLSVAKYYGRKETSAL
ncbi:hypothetical protein Tco_0318975 [Tanacetum coccineum]